MGSGPGVPSFSVDSAARAYGHSRSLLAICPHPRHPSSSSSPPQAPLPPLSPAAPSPASTGVHMSVCSNTDRRLLDASGLTLSPVLCPPPTQILYGEVGVESNAEAELRVG
ncbi:unnamed protein product [Cyclocybe aegerita]|uniref:Uncharacterized protein n=1 Tax=Cyclocybe aegerita TaxID=1973307 RepID=A0A8S0XTA8_CYCAE|nr:unnamed protein product [Cyclocybe aegerita]